MNKVQQILLIMIVWALALVGIDKRLNTHPERAAADPTAGKPQITMTFEHFCCEGCYDGMFASVKHYPWLSKPKVIQQSESSLPTQTTPSDREVPMQSIHQADVKESSGQVSNDHNYEGSAIADLNTQQLALIDFVALDHTVRDEGMVMKGLKLTGIPHFALVASGLHICCNLCVDATKAVFRKEGKSTPAMTQLHPVKTPEVNRIDKTVRAEFYNEADVMLFKRSIEEMGLAARSIRIEILN